MSKKIAITNIVSLNPGDAAILAGMIEILHAKYGDDVKIVVFDKNAEAATPLYPWARFVQAPFHKTARHNFVSKTMHRSGYGHWIIRLRYWRLRVLGLILRFRPLHPLKAIFSREDRDTVREYVTSDLIVSTGGTYLVENYGLWPAIYDYRLCLGLGRPLVFFTQTLGPFTQNKYKKSFQKIFTRASAVFLRDERSRQHLIEIGIPRQRIWLAKDAAFALPARDRANKRTAADRRLKVAISVRSLRFFSDDNQSRWMTYLESIRAMVEILTNQFQAEVVFLSTCQGIPDYWADDAAIADEVITGLSANAVIGTRVDRRFRQPAEIVDAYSGFDLVIATRMHSAILSLLAGTPVIGIAYEFKLEELFSQLDMGRLSVPIHAISPQTAKEALFHAMENLDILRNRIAATIEIARSEAYSVMSNLPELRKLG